MAGMKKSIQYISELNLDNEDHKALKIKIDQHIQKLMNHYIEELSFLASDFKVIQSCFDCLFEDDEEGEIDEETMRKCLQYKKNCERLLTEASDFRC